QAWYPGALGGKAIANILSGECSPSGKLPVTFYKSISQLPPFTQYEMTTQTYRYMKETPLYPFGYGLTYSHFKFKDIKIEKKEEYLFNVSVTILNEGLFDTYNVIEMYIKTPESNVKSPKYQLKQFRKEFFRSNQQQTVTFIIDEQAMSFIDGNGHRVILKGDYTVYINDGQPDEYTETLYGRKALATAFTVNVPKRIDY
ncbi:MAG: glycoside hydrolase family 3 C-terminal domain-containing protein, partial [Clostridia bacterium]|nr:glycoside hydrolase family 3 C-terminal domain-containing protein [Clostridia bacterium]